MKSPLTELSSLGHFSPSRGMCASSGATMFTTNVRQTEITFQKSTRGSWVARRRWEELRSRERRRPQVCWAIPHLGTQAQHRRPVDAVQHKVACCTAVCFQNGKDLHSDAASLSKLFFGELVVRQAKLCVVVWVLCLSFVEQIEAPHKHLCCACGNCCRRNQDEDASPADLAQGIRQSQNASADESVHDRYSNFLPARYICRRFDRRWPVPLVPFGGQNLAVVATPRLPTTHRGAELDELLDLFPVNVGSASCL